MLKNKRFLLTILVALLLLLIPSMVRATDTNQNLSENSSLPKFTDYSNAEFEIIQEDNYPGGVVLKITGIDENSILDYREQYNFWGYHYFITPNNTKPEVIFEDDGRVKSINGELVSDTEYNFASHIIHNEEKDCILLYDARFFF